MLRIVAGTTLVCLLGISACTDSQNPTTSESVLEVSSEGYTDINSSALDTSLSSLDGTVDSELSPLEIEGIRYMREEEKLARDVYLYLGEVWGQKVFNNIASSEQSHMDAMLTLIDRYQLEDPAAGNANGEFTDPTLQGLYNQLTAEGDASLIDALYVGAAIEEIDIIDIEASKLDVVANDDIILVYDNLLKGSRNHLRAFVKNIEQQGVTYQPRYLSAEIYNQIISGDVETGSAN